MNQTLSIKVYSDLMNSFQNNKCIVNKQSAEAHIENARLPKLGTVENKIRWGDSISIKDPKINFVADSLSILVKGYTVFVAEYIENQIKDFLEENKISEKSWKKRGVIQSLPPDIYCNSYILYYKTWKKECKRKISIGYDILTK